MGGRPVVLERATPRPARVHVRMGSDTTASFVGYALTTGDPYAVRDWLGEYTETILPGACRKTITEQKSIPLLHNHNPDVVLASTGSGTSRLAEDTIGLRNEADLDRRQSYTNDLCIGMERGDIGAMSFSFAPVKEAWNAGYDQRTVSELRLYDTSIVTNPMSPNTTAGLRAAMRSQLGREGRSILLASHETSVRTALPAVLHGDGLGVRGEELLERAFRALDHADEQLHRRYGHARARTMRVGEAMLELRAGRVLSAANEQLLTTALQALSDAGDHHAKAHDAVSNVLNNATGDGTENGTPPGNGNPILPQDGAGPRSARPLRLKREREAELRRMGIGRRRTGRSPAELAAERELELRRLRASAPGQNRRRS